MAYLQTCQKSHVFLIAVGILYLCYVGFPAPKRDILNSVDHCSWIVASVKAERMYHIQNSKKNHKRWYYPLFFTSPKCQCAAKYHLYDACCFSMLLLHIAVIIYNFINCSFSFITDRTARRAALPVLFLPGARFFGFRSAEATRCTDQGEIWQGGADRR